MASTMLWSFAIITVNFYFRVIGRLLAVSVECRFSFWHERESFRCSSSARTCENYRRRTPSTVPVRCVRVFSHHSILDRSSSNSGDSHHETTSTGVLQYSSTLLSSSSTTVVGRELVFSAFLLVVDTVS